MKLVITGTGRSGTGYCAELLRACGVACGHEAVFTPDVALDRKPINWAGHDADVSWLATPVLHSPVLVDTHTVLVTRHPAAVVRSWLELGIFDRDDDYIAVIRRHTPRTLAGWFADRALAHWTSWNLLAAARAAEIVRLEDIGAAHLTRWLYHLGRGDVPIGEVDEALAIPRTVNAKDEAKRRIGPLDHSMFSQRLLDRAAPIIDMFGYGDWLGAG